MLSAVPDNLSDVLGLVRDADMERLRALDDAIDGAGPAVVELLERCQALWLDFGEGELRAQSPETKEAVSLATGFDATMARAAALGAALQAASSGDHLEVMAQRKRFAPTVVDLQVVDPPDPGGPTPDDDAVERYLESITFRNYSPGTIKNRRYLLTRFRSWIAPVELLEVDAATIVAWLKRPMRGVGDRSPAAVAGDRAGLVAFFKWAIMEGLRVDNPCDRVPRPKQPHRMPRPISEADLARAIDTAAARVKPMLVLAAFAGLRACEIAQLRGEDVDLEADPPMLTIQRQKGGDQSVVPIGPAVAVVLAAMPSTGWLFPRVDGEPGPVKPHLVSKLSNDHLHRLGILHTLHTLRHRFGTQVYRGSGRDIRAAQELLRHRSITSTAIYTQSDMSENAATVNALPSVDRSS